MEKNEIVKRTLLVDIALGNVNGEVWAFARASINHRCHRMRSGPERTAVDYSVG